MLFKAENDKISIAVNQYGAQLSSFRSKETGIEYLWQADEKIWKEQCPVLFPIVGTLLDNKYRVDGTEFSLGRHGLAKLYDFQLKEQGDDYIILTQSYTPETLKAYPYKYTLDIEFRLSGKKLTVTNTVKNSDNKKMYFSIGAHPGFNCEIGDYIEFEKNETLVCEKVDAEGILDGKHYPTLTDEKRFYITEHVFDDDAHVLSGMKSEYVYLKSDKRPQQIKFYIGKAPYLGLWAKPNAPYVCIEPWYGINDARKLTEDFSQKRCIQSVEPDGEFIFPYSAEIIE